MLRRLQRVFGKGVAPEIRITSYVHSERGGSHAANEDAVVVRQHARASGLWVCCLSDGQGGRADGARAAQLAVQQSMVAALDCPPRSLREPLAFERIVRAADAVVYAEPRAGFATLVALAVSRDLICGASCGDSAVLLLQNDKISTLTEGQAKDPPVGSHAVDAVPFSLDLEPPWRLCAISDGVWKYAGWGQVYTLMRRLSGSALVDALREAVVRHSSGVLPDDFSIAVLDCREEGS